MTHDKTHNPLQLRPELSIVPRKMNREDQNRSETSQNFDLKNQTSRHKWRRASDRAEPDGSSWGKMNRISRFIAVVITAFSALSLVSLLIFVNTHGHENVVLDELNPFGSVEDVTLPVQVENYRTMFLYRNLPQ